MLRNYSNEIYLYLIMHILLTVQVQIKDFVALHE